MKNKALIIVDMQNDFLPGGALEVEHGDDVIPVINRVKQDFDIVVATQDWHPDGHSSFASSHTDQKPFDVIDLYGAVQVLWPDHCVQGSDGADFTAELDMSKVRAVFRKGMDPEVDSYSGFFDNSRAHRTGMAGYLHDLDVSDIYISGLAADYCVYYTAKDGQELGFNTYFIKNATRAIDQDGYQVAMEDLKQRGVGILEWRIER